MAVKITQKAYDGIMAVRASGRVNMLDRKGVQRVANDLEGVPPLVADPHLHLLKVYDQPLKNDRSVTCLHVVGR